MDKIQSGNQPNAGSKDKTSAESKTGSNPGTADRKPGRQTLRMFTSDTALEQREKQ